MILICPHCAEIIVATPLGAIKSRRVFFPARIECRGKKSLPFTTREPDFVPDENTVRRKTDRFDDLLTRLYVRRNLRRR